MGWFDRLLGRSEPDLNGQIGMSAAFKKALLEERNALRIEVVQDVRGQMAKIFEVVGDLRGQVSSLTGEKNSLSNVLHEVQKTLRETTKKLNRLSETVQDNASKNAHGFSEVSKRLDQMGGVHLTEKTEVSPNLKP